MCNLVDKELKLKILSKPVGKYNLNNNYRAIKKIKELIDEGHYNLSLSDDETKLIVREKI